MNNKKGNKTLVILGAIILGIFISTSMVNIAEKDEYYLSTDVVKSTNYVDGKLVVETNDYMTSVCVKQTKTEPDLDSLCWVDTIDNKASMSIYEYKTYHIWTKDANNVVSYYAKYNTNNN